jgi:hypothetical protein
MKRGLSFMKLARAGMGAASTLAIAAIATTAGAADHRDGDTVKLDPAADINDVYAFMDGDDVVLGMTVSPFADVNTKFSDAVQYVWHVNKAPDFDGTPGGSTNVICEFATDQTISCWIGTADFVTGDASNQNGIPSDGGMATVFAGLRADPFYFYLTGFNNARAAVLAAAGSLTFNPNGCPALGLTTATALQTALTATMQSDNDFATANTLAIVIRADKSLFVDATNPYFSVYASTHTKPQ